MRTRYLLAVLMTWTLTRGCGQDRRNNVHGAASGTESDFAAKPAERVPFVALLAVPEKWDGVRVRVVGYLPEKGYEIFLTSEHEKSIDFRSAIGLDCCPSLRSSERLMSRLEFARAKYVDVEGTFRSNVGCGEFNGGGPLAICGITDLHLLGP